MLKQRVRNGAFVPLAVVLALAGAGRADQGDEIKAIEQAGGKVRILRLQTRTDVSINLSGCQKADEVLKKLAVLKGELSGLNLNQSGVTDAGIKALADCKTLRVLQLSGTAITDAALADLRDLPFLSQLEVPKTKVSAAGLRHLKAFPRLGTLSVSGPAVSDAGLKHLGDSKTLIYLTLIDGTELTATGLAELKRLKGLFGLHLLNCAVTAEALEGFKDSAGLRVLSVTRRKLTPELIAAVKALTQVTELDLSETGYIPTAEDFQHVRHLSLRKATLTPETAKALGKFKGLQSLTLTGANLTDEMLPELMNLKGLTSLELSETKVTDAGIQALKDSGHITYLYLRKTAVTKAGARKLKSSLQSTYILMD